MKQILNALKLVTPPKMVREALALYGTLETPGTRDNSTIVQWSKETKTKDDDWYAHDSVPWCGLFMAVCAQRAGKAVPINCLGALSWRAFGMQVPVAMLGDVLVFTRKGGGHVGLYVGESKDSYFVLGGNQGDKVCITRILKSRIHSIRRPIYNEQPESVKQYFYTNTGDASTNEG
jgi:uncharacterized protein (TIGR02594 family)